MAVSRLACCVFGKETSNLLSITRSIIEIQPSRSLWKPVHVPKGGVNGKSFRRIVHFKDKYTIEPLQVTNLGGRDPVTGRLAVKGIGGGIKHKYHWIQWIRDGPEDLDEKPKEERVLEIFEDGCRTSFVALVGTGRELKYILATENMKVGDILRTHRGIPRNPVRPAEGDAYPLGALPDGTKVNCVEQYPGKGGALIHAAGDSGTVLRRHDEDYVVVQLPSKKEYCLHKTCMATVGRLSNVDHGDTPIGSAQRNRWLGNRPRSGLWQRKDGRFGRKVKGPPKMKVVDPSAPIIREKVYSLNLSAHNQEN